MSKDAMQKLFNEIMDEAEQQEKAWKAFESKCTVKRDSVEYTPHHFVPACTKYNRWCSARCPDYQASFNQRPMAVKKEEEKTPEC
jgi:hypothetical protein